MKIVDKSVNEILFENIAVGDTFKFDARLFMKVSNEHNGDPNAYDFSKNRLTHITDDTTVRHVSSELIIYGSGWNELSVG